MSQPTTTRRNALRTIAATVGVTTVGVGALYGIDEAMGAHVSGTYTFTDPDPLVNDTGELVFVSVTASTDIQWTGFEVPVTHVGFTEVVEVRDDTGLLAGPAVYWGQRINDLTAAHPAALADPTIGNSGSPYALDPDNPDHAIGTSGGIFSGGDSEQVLVDENGDGSRDGSAIVTEPLTDDEVFEPGYHAGTEGDGETKTTTVVKTEFCHLYNGPTNSEGVPQPATHEEMTLIHPSNYDWAPGAAEVTGEFDVVVEDIESSTDGSSGDGTGDSG